MVAVYQTTLKPLPDGLSVAGPIRAVPAENVRFLHDLTYRSEGLRMTEQRIFDQALELIRGAEDVVLADLFLFNGLLGRERTAHRGLSRELADALLDRRRSSSALNMIVITDPLNEVYGGAPLPLFDELRAAGIPLVSTNLIPLRDSNPIYSAGWRVTARWLGTSPGGGLPHPLQPKADGVGLRSWLALMNFKANHRKVIVADVTVPAGGRGLASLVMSANPHDGSSAHGNVGLLVRDDALARDIWRSEHAVVRFSDEELADRLVVPGGMQAERETAPLVPVEILGVRLLTEGKIREALVDALNDTGAGDAVDVGMFYLSDRTIVGALTAAAAERGVRMRLILDPNRDAFGHRKNGVPNRPVAAELVRRGGNTLAVRWYDTHGEQFHSKLVHIRKADGQSVLIAGSANLTRRNLGDFNLETNLEISGDSNAEVFLEAGRYFDRLWASEDHSYTVAYERFADDSLLKRWQYLLQERTGLGTF